MNEQKEKDKKKNKKKVGKKKEKEQKEKEGSYLLGTHHLEILSSLLSLLFTISISNRYF